MALLQLVPSDLPRSQSNLKWFLLDKQESPQLSPLQGLARRFHIVCPHKPRKDQSHLCQSQVSAQALPRPHAKRLHSMSLIMSERRGFFRGIG